MEDINLNESCDFLTASSVSYYTNIIKNSPKANNDSNITLLRQYREEDNLIARDLLIKTNLGLVLSIAKKYQYNRESYQLIDIIQEGIIGLLKSIKSFDFNAGFNFSTYAGTCIQNEIRNSLSTFDKEIRRPQSFTSLVLKYDSIIKERKENGELLPTDNEFCELLGISKKRLNEIKEDRNLNVKSLNTKLTDDENSELETIIVDQNNHFDSLLDNMDDVSLLLALKKRLSPYHYYILYKKNFSDEKINNHMLADILGLSHQTISMTERLVRTNLKDIITSEGIENLFDEYDETSSIDPIDPEEVISYLFYRDSLTEEEKKLYKLIISKEYAYDEKLYANIMGINLETYNKILNSLNRKITNEDESLKKAYECFKEEIKKKYGSKIFAIDLDINLDDVETNVKYVSNFWNSISHEDALKIISKNNIKISKNMGKLISKYFNSPSENNRNNTSNRVVEREVNTLLFGYNKKCKKVVDGLYDFLVKNCNSFTNEEYWYLMMQVFHKISKKDFKTKYPDSKLYDQQQSLIYKLESMYFNISNYREYNFTKDKYSQIRDKALKQLSKEKVYILDEIYGFNGKEKSIEEIASNLGLTYEEAKSQVNIARYSVVHVYLNRNRQRNIEKDYYIPYILDKDYDIPDLTREILHEYLIEELSYEEISLKHGINKRKVSTTVSSGIEKIDFYRFGIFKIENKFTPDEIEKVYNLDKFNDDERQLITMKLAAKSREEMIKATGLTFERIAYILDKFYKKCKEVKVSDVKVDLSDIEKEVTCHISERVLNDTERLLLSELYGIKCDLNPEGIKYEENEFRIRHKEYSKAFNRIHSTAIKSIKSKRIGLKRASVAYMDREELRKSLLDPRIPIDNKARELLYYSFELNGYPYKSLKELESIFDTTSSILKLRIQRAFVTIFKYENDELGADISYEYDVEPYLQFFAKSDQAILTDLYRDNLTYEEIAKRHGLNQDQVERIIIRLDSYLHDLFDDLVNGFDFNYFWSVIDNEDIPFYGDKEKAKRIFYLYYEERMSRNDIINALNLDCSPSAISRTINNLMMSVLKRKNGVKKVNTYSYEDIKEYYDRYSYMMDENKKSVYDKYFEYVEKVSQENILSVASSSNINSEIICDLIKDQKENPFIIGKTSRDEVINIIKNNRRLLSKTTIDTLINKYDIEKRELMSGSEQMKVLRFLSTLKNKDKILAYKRSA